MLHRGLLYACLCALCCPTGSAQQGSGIVERGGTPKTALILDGNNPPSSMHGRPPIALKDKLVKAKVGKHPVDLLDEFVKTKPSKQPAVSQEGPVKPEPNKRPAIDLDEIVKPRVPHVVIDGTIPKPFGTDGNVLPRQPKPRIPVGHNPSLEHGVAEAHANATLEAKKIKIASPLSTTILVPTATADECDQSQIALGSVIDKNKYNIEQWGRTFNHTNTLSKGALKELIKGGGERCAQSDE